MIKGILKAIGKGIIKALPLSGFLKDLKFLKLQERIKDLKPGIDSKLSPDEKQSLYTILDLLDDGQLNKSFDSKLIERGFELLIAISTIITAIKYFL